MISTILLRSAGYPDPAVDWPWLPVLIRDWGPLAFAIPGAWVIATILLERRDAGAFTQRWTIVSGLAVTAVLVGVYSWPRPDCRREPWDPAEQGSPPSRPVPARSRKVPTTPSGQPPFVALPRSRAAR